MDDLESLTKIVKNLEDANKILTNDMSNKSSQIKQLQDQLKGQDSHLRNVKELQEITMALEDIYINGNSDRYKSLKQKLKGQIDHSYAKFQMMKTFKATVSKLADVALLEEKIKSINKHNFGFYIGETQDPEVEAIPYLRNTAPGSKIWKDYIKDKELVRLHTYYVVGASSRERELVDRYSGEERCLNMKKGSEKEGGILYLVHYDMDLDDGYECPNPNCPAITASKIGAVKHCWERGQGKGK